MSDTPAPAGNGARVLARLVDVLVLGAIGAVVASAVLRVVPGGGGVAAPGFPASLVLSVVLFAVYVGYEVAFTALYGATPGKYVLRLRVVAAEQAERDPAAARATASGVLLRSGVLYASVLLNSVPIVNLLGLGVSLYAVVSALLDRPRHRGLHDRVGSTVVVRARAHSVSS